MMRLRVQDGSSDTATNFLKGLIVLDFMNSLSSTLKGLSLFVGLLVFMQHFMRFWSFYYGNLLCNLKSCPNDLFFAIPFLLQISF